MAQTLAGSTSFYLTVVTQFHLPLAAVRVRVMVLSRTCDEPPTMVAVITPAGVAVVMAIVVFALAGCTPTAASVTAGVALTARMTGMFNKPTATINQVRPDDAAHVEWQSPKKIPAGVAASRDFSLRRRRSTGQAVLSRRYWSCCGGADASWTNQFLFNRGRAAPLAACCSTGQGDGRVLDLR